jgi:LysR family hydrogen peroxide-inducible transcriptional activator
MVAAGVGISLVPEMAIDRDASCRYVRLSDTRATRTIVAAVLRGRSFNRVQQAFLLGIQNGAQIRDPSNPAVRGKRSTRSGEVLSGKTS